MKKGFAIILKAKYLLIMKLLIKQAIKKTQQSAKYDVRQSSTAWASLRRWWHLVASASNHI